MEVPGEPGEREPGRGEWCDTEEPIGEKWSDESFGLDKTGVAKK